MFWTKFCELCEGQGLKPRKIAAEFDVAPATVTRWKHGSVPRADTLEKIAARLGVTPDFMLSEEEYMINPSEKRSTFKKITAVPQRWAGLHSGFDLTNQQLMAIAEYVNCDIFYLNRDDPTYTPLNRKDKERDKERAQQIEPLLDILDIMDACADTANYEILQIQLSRIALYNLNKAGWGKKKLSGNKYIPTGKLKFLYTGDPDKDANVNFGLNYSELSAIRYETGISYVYMFTGVK